MKIDTVLLLAATTINIILFFAIAGQGEVGAEDAYDAQAEEHDAGVHESKRFTDGDVGETPICSRSYLCAP